MKNLFPKVLVSCPTAKAKNYCLREYLTGVMNLKYPNYNIRLYDNTSDSGTNAKHINNVFKDIYGENKEKFFCENSLVKNGYKKHQIKSVIEKMVVSHNDCRNEAINGGYEWLLHLESDVIPMENTIEQLMCHGKRVVGAPYYRDNGKDRRLCMQRRVYNSPHNILAENFFPEDDVCFLDGTLKEIAHCGLGCVLIHVDILKKFPFRAIKNVGVHPDSYFAEDCFKNGIKIYVDTSLLCEHHNTNWGIYGVDFN